PVGPLDARVVRAPGTYHPRSGSAGDGAGRGSNSASPPPRRLPRASSVTVPVGEPVVEAPSGRGRHGLWKVAMWLLAIALLVAILQLLGVDVTGWLSSLWDQITGVPPAYIVAALIVQSGQTFFAGYSYYGILQAAYPGEVLIAPIVTAYAVGVAMNGF